MKITWFGIVLGYNFMIKYSEIFLDFIMKDYSMRSILLCVLLNTSFCSVYSMDLELSLDYQHLLHNEPDKDSLTYFDRMQILAEEQILAENHMEQWRLNSELTDIAIEKRAQEIVARNTKRGSFLGAGIGAGLILPLFKRFGFSRGKLIGSITTGSTITILGATSGGVVGNRYGLDRACKITEDLKRQGGHKITSVNALSVDDILSKKILHIVVSNLYYCNVPAKNMYGEDTECDGPMKAFDGKYTHCVCSLCLYNKVRKEHEKAQKEYIEMILAIGQGERAPSGRGQHIYKKLAQKSFDKRLEATGRTKIIKLFVYE